MPTPDDPSLPDKTSKTLLLRLRADGTAREVAWQDFYATYQPIITAFARRLGASGGEAEELVQDVINGFFKALPDFSYDPATGRFRGYLKTCVCRKLESLRRARNPQANSTSHDFQDLAAETTWNDVWETEKLHRALAIVRERYAGNAERIRTFRAFELCTLLERSNEEVAAQLHLSTESVRAAKSRVSKALKQAFDELDEATG